VQAQKRGLNPLQSGPKGGKRTEDLKKRIPIRKNGAQKLRGGADWGELRILRYLQVKPVG
jgi:hypothetical protein